MLMGAADNLSHAFAGSGSSVPEGKDPELDSDIAKKKVTLMLTPADLCCTVEYVAPAVSATFSSACECKVQAAGITPVALDHAAAQHSLTAWMETGSVANACPIPAAGSVFQRS